MVNLAAIEKNVHVVKPSTFLLQVGTDTHFLTMCVYLTFLHYHSV